MSVKQGVKGVKELFLKLFLTSEELDIVDEKQVDVPILLAERM